MSLTRREYDVMFLKFDGAGNKRVASDLGISEQTVKNHLSSVFRKLGVQGRGIWGAFRVLGWLGGPLDAERIVAIRADVRAEFQAALDAVGTTQATGPGRWPFAVDTSRQVHPRPVAQSDRWYMP